MNSGQENSPFLKFCCCLYLVCFRAVKDYIFQAKQSFPSMLQVSCVCSEPNYQLLISQIYWIEATLKKQMRTKQIFLGFFLFLQVKLCRGLFLFCRFLKKQIKFGS